MTPPLGLIDPHWNFIKIYSNRKLESLNYHALLFA